MAAPVTEAAIEKIRQLIISGRLAPGSRLPAEAVLAQDLGLSRGTVREAVRALVATRVLDVRRGDGSYVTSLRPELLLEGMAFAADLMQDEAFLELVEVRRVLEPAATALAAVRAMPANLAALAATLDRMRASAHDYEALVGHDAHFHELVAQAAGNSTMASMLSGLSGRTQRSRVWRGIMEADAIRLTIAEHERIYAALLARDPELSHAAALVHVATTQSWLRRVLGGDEPQDSTPNATA